jgi:flagellar hook assembly protein FlgD
LFNYDSGSSEDGTVAFPLSNLQTLSLGSHVIRFSASDNLHNTSFAQIGFVVVNDLSIDRLVNFPNPFGSDTYIYFEVPAAANELFAEVKIYTVSGRLIKQIGPDLVAGTAQLRWDGRDEYGEEVATGVYFYKVELWEEGGTRISKIGKAAKVRGLGPVRK